MPPLVSIALPIFNSEKTLRETLDSVLGQTFEDFEVLAFVDESKDRSLEIARSCTDKRIRVIYDGQVRSLPQRLNEMAHMAQGRYMARMDADDIMHPQRLERQVAVMQADPTIDVLGTDAWQIDDRMQVFGYYRSEEPTSDPWVAVQSCIFIHPAVLGHTEWFRKNPYIVTGTPIPEDHELWTRTCSHSHFANLHEPLLFYRMRGAKQMKRDLICGRYTDELILEWGERLGRADEAGRIVKRRRQYRFVWQMTGVTGLRRMKRWLKRTAGQTEPMKEAQMQLNEILKADIGEATATE
jgi:glycosyltransferase involved in cell wall biosynthesis